MCVGCPCVGCVCGLSVWVSAQNLCLELRTAYHFISTSTDILVAKHEHGTRPRLDTSKRGFAPSFASARFAQTRRLRRLEAGILRALRSLCRPKAAPAEGSDIATDPTGDPHTCRRGGPTAPFLGQLSPAHTCGDRSGYCHSPLPDPCDASSSGRGPRAWRATWKQNLPPPRLGACGSLIVRRPLASLSFPQDG